MAALVLHEAVAVAADHGAAVDVDALTERDIFHDDDAGLDEAVGSDG